MTGRESLGRGVQYSSDPVVRDSFLQTPARFLPEAARNLLVPTECSTLPTPAWVSDSDIQRSFEAQWTRPTAPATSRAPAAPTIEATQPEGRVSLGCSTFLLERYCSLHQTEFNMLARGSSFPQVGHTFGAQAGSDGFRGGKRRGPSARERSAVTRARGTEAAGVGAGGSVAPSSARGAGGTGRRARGAPQLLHEGRVKPRNAGHFDGIEGRKNNVYSICNRV